MNVEVRNRTGERLIVSVRAEFREYLYPQESVDFSNRKPVFVVVEIDKMEEEAD
jgi:hypothetical protein